MCAPSRSGSPKRGLSNAPKIIPFRPAVAEEWGVQCRRVCSNPLLIPGQEGGTVGSGCQIRNQRGRKPPPTNFREFRCPGEGRGRGRHLERIQGPGGKAGTERARIELLIADGGKAPRIASETGSGHFFPIGNDHLPVPLHAPPAGCGVY